METLQGILERSKYTYEIIQHEKPILSKQDGTKYFGIEVGQTAPSLILKTDKGFFVLIVSGSRSKVDFEKIADVLGCSKVKLASPEEVQKVTGFQVGSVRMVGLDLPCVIDKRLFQYDFIYGGTGQSTFTLKIEPQALNELNQVIVTFD
ncbi:aminoacyl-tRNA deacylase [Bacillus benzoevorans]|uniref:Prolyl-tRNA editing enzyme YbaK/EbsC (Cys-tRNA(Pro) deacylase) n=1 Tax=Bacillus benzoevorans TaxID=1456 RepID=A0A7X0LXU0_9BACI|nr:YbaK/EbsC family protein [Bacillus benzoevorans]MBB6447985.1 prolyl-tRNA editing enzyme YbaK/EbsC (Cys-tRNA(Pro) deacylase) [Bacillus benzoevorans]